MRALAAFAVLMLVTACQTAPPPEPEFTDADRQEIAAEIEGLFNEFMARNTPAEAPENFAMWSPNAESYYVPGPALFSQGFNLVPTLEDVRGFFDPSNWSRQSTNISSNEVSVAVLTPESAVVVADGHFSVTNAEGVTGPEAAMTMTGVWVKEGGAWKIVHWHQSWDREPFREG